MDWKNTPKKVKAEVEEADKKAHAQGNRNDKRPSGERRPGIRKIMKPRKIHEGAK